MYSQRAQKETQSPLALSLSRGAQKASSQAGSAAYSDDVLAASILGQGLPLAAEQHLRAASRSYHDDAVAERHLHAARALAPDHAAVLIGLYRFYFYKNRLREALDVARLCLQKSAIDNGFDADWRNVQRTHACFDRYESVLPRFFLFTLKGYAYLQLRLGHLDEGADAIAKLLELDPSDKLGARVLLGVLERIGHTDDD